ncbi:ATP-binding protein [uncultured Clostridium sp.]|uniref:ATP-binding protein n=1 Tax=uncultured Clostridium sp. TaxID=59620 RepID=UPI00261FF3D4|nr:ATP-binding protein [uncultured Clostridium sp.]
MKDIRKIYIFMVAYIIATILPVFILVNKVPVYVVWIGGAILTVYLLSVKKKKFINLGLLFAFVITAIQLFVIFLVVDHEKMIALSICISMIHMINSYIIYKLINNRGRLNEANLYKIIDKTFFRVIPTIGVSSVLEQILYSIGRANNVDFALYNFLLPNFLGYVLVFSVVYIIFKNNVRKIVLTFRFYIFFIVIFIFNIEEISLANVFDMNRSHLEYLSIFILVLACIILKPEEFIFLIIEDFIVSFFMISHFLDTLSMMYREYMVLDLQLFYTVVMATAFFLIVLKSENKRLIEEISIKNNILEKEVEDNKEMLKKVTLLIDSIKNTAFIADEDGEIIYSNNEFKKLIDVKNIKDKQCLYKVFYDLKKGAKNIIRKEINVKESFIMQEIFISNYENKTFISGIGTDITRLKRIQEKLENSKKEAEDANNAKTSLISRVSHELKTPMNTITAVNFLLSETNLDNKQRDYIKKIDKASEFLLKMIEDILFVSKVTKSKLNLEESKIDFFDMIQTIIMLKEDVIRKKGIKFIYFIDRELPSYVIGDAFRIKQILINIIGNSIKFTEEGFINFTVKWLYQREDMAYIKFIIEDTGIGISAEKKDKIFEPFTQEDEGIARKYGGTGIGLTICKNLAEQMNGEIHLESQKGMGSRFEVTIPFKIYNETKEDLEQISQVIEAKEETREFYNNEVDEKIILRKLSYIEEIIKIDLGETIDKIEELFKEVSGTKYEEKVEEIKELIDTFKLDEAIKQINNVKKILIV